MGRLSRREPPISRTNLRPPAGQGPDAGHDEREQSPSACLATAMVSRRPLEKAPGASGPYEPDGPDAGHAEREQSPPDLLAMAMVSRRPLEPSARFSRGIPRAPHRAHRAHRAHYGARTRQTSRPRPEGTRHSHIPATLRAPSARPQRSPDALRNRGRASRSRSAVPARRRSPRHRRRNGAPSGASS